MISMRKQNQVKKVYIRRERVYKHTNRPLSTDVGMIGKVEAKGYSDKKGGKG